jgi:hypothetical protein
MPTRRQFLRTGVVGGAALAAVGAWYWHAHRGAGAVPGPPLDAAGRGVVAALAPVLLAGALPPGEAGMAAVRDVVAGVERAVAGLSAAAQKEVGQLFALLALAPTRLATAGLTSSWEHASPADIAAFLERWRHSRFGLLQSGYAALHDLVLGAWYATPESWEAIGYAGPPELLT